MIKAKKSPFFIKHFLMLTVFICLISGIFTPSLKASSSYVTSLSNNCINTFTIDITPSETTASGSVSQNETTASEEQDASSATYGSDSGTPKTGDYLWFNLICFLTGCAVLTAAWIFERSKDTESGIRKL